MAKTILTWKEKLAKGIKLNSLEETQADADYNYRKRLREEEEKREYELSKLGSGAPIENQIAADANAEDKEKKGK